MMLTNDPQHISYHDSDLLLFLMWESFLFLLKTNQRNSMVGLIQILNVYVFQQQYFVFPKVCIIANHGLPHIQPLTLFLQKDGHFCLISCPVTGSEHL